MLTTYDIFNDVLQLRDLVEDFFTGVPSTRNRVHEYPYINIHEMGETILLKAIMPGVNKGDVNIELNGDSLLIEGERPSDISDKPYIRKERSFGRFKKSLKLPYPINKDTINANLKDGILTVTLEKSEEAKPKRIDIK